MPRRSLLLSVVLAVALLVGAGAAGALLVDSLGSNVRDGNTQPLDDNHPAVSPPWQRPTASGPAGDGGSEPAPRGRHDPRGLRSGADARGGTTVASAAAPRQEGTPR